MRRDFISLQIVRQLEAVNQVKAPLESELLNGKWELLYTTSTSILQSQVSFPSCLGIITVPNNPSPVQQHSRNQSSFPR
jgi:hypothetical protein